MKRRTLLVITIALLIILIGATVYSLAYAETFRCTVSQGETVNVRSAPSTKASTGGKRLYSGNTVNGTFTQGGTWIEYLDDNHEYCYVMAKYMEIDYTGRCTISANGRVRWRKTPGGKTGGWYQPDDEVFVWGIAVDSKGNLWGRIAEGKWALGGHYVSLDYIADNDGKLLSELYKTD